MRKFIKLILSGILFIWSYSMFMTLTDDSNFGTVKYKNKIKYDINMPRISMINIMLGSRALYVITYNIKLKKFKFVEYNRLEDLFILHDNEMFEITERYNTYLKSNTMQEDKDIEKEALLYHIGNEEKRIDKSSEKINVYTTIILTVIPISLAITKVDYFYSFNILQIVLFIFILYALLNITLFVLQSLKIQSVNKSKFSDLKKCSDHKVEINLKYQYDWQFLKRKADLSVSYVKNMQYWINGILILFFILSSTLMINAAHNEVTYKNSNNHQIINIYINDLKNPYSNSSIALTEIILRVQRKETEKILIISNYKNNLDEDIINNIIKTYSNLLVEYIYDDEINKNLVKIVEE